MIRLGFIVPVRYIDWFATQSNYHLVLAHLVEKNPSYRDMYRKLSKRGDYLTLDNSSYELGDDIYDADQLLDLADSVGASEIMAPEFYGDGEKTKELVLSFIDKVKTKKRKPIKVFATIHGKDPWDLTDCYRKCFLNGVDTIGISCRLQNTVDLNQVKDKIKTKLNKELEKNIMFRYILLNEILPYYGEKNVEFHYLGLNHPLELMLARKVKRFKIRSLDTSGPFMAAMFNEPFDRVMYRKSGKRVDLETFGFDYNLPSKSNLTKVSEYINYLKHLAGYDE